VDARKLGIPLGVAAVTAACFSPILGNGFVSFDDPVAFLENPSIREISPSSLGWMFTTLHMATYQPLSWLLYAVDYALWGPDPRGFHLTALLLHAANAALAYAVLRALLRCIGAADDALAAGAAAAGALFYALHPLRVEPVAWISARGQLQATAFHLLTVLCYLWAHLDPPRRRRWLAASVGAFLLCMLSKNHALGVPLVLLVIDHFVLRRPTASESWTGLVWGKAPYFAIAGGAAAFAVLAKTLTGATAMTADVPHGLPERLLQAGYGFVFYPARMLAPFQLSPLYPLERQIAGREPVFYATAALSLALVIACIGLRRRAPALLAALLAYAILVAPVLGFTQGGPQLVADRYSYDPMLPWASLFCVGLWRLALRSPRPARRALAAGVALLLLALGGLSAQQTRIWRDGISLWTRAVALDPESPLLRMFLANTLREEGRFEAAIDEYSRALDGGVHRPAEAYNGRAASHHALGHAEQALADAERAVGLEPRNAGFLLNRGLVRGETDLPGAVADWNAALRIDPGLAPAYYNRGIAREALGDRAGAVADYERALAIGLEEEDARRDAARRLAAFRRRP
jgi:tetratricopeptide (TPR) repeat protein